MSRLISLWLLTYSDRNTNGAIPAGHKDPILLIVKILQRVKGRVIHRFKMPSLVKSSSARVAFLLSAAAMLVTPVDRRKPMAARPLEQLGSARDRSWGAGHEVASRLRALAVLVDLARDLTHLGDTRPIQILVQRRGGA